MTRHILILNRWDNEFGRYHRYVDHTVDRVAYLTTAAGRNPLSEEIAEEIVTVPDLGDTSSITTAAKELAAKHGPFTHIIALSEFDLEMSAALRQVLDVPGKSPADVQRVRDKVTMKTHIAAAGLRVPRFTDVETPSAVKEFSATSGFPVVLKPRAGADSQGVMVVRSASELESILGGSQLVDYECEEFVHGTLYQVDGLIQDGRLRTARSWQCHGTCLDFALGKPFASVANDDVDFERRVFAYTEHILAALGLTDDVFHLEVFRTADPPTPDDPFADIVFLEIGARAGGGQVRFVWLEVYGLDLIEASIRVQLGEHIDVPTMDHETVGGYLMMPEPPSRPCIVERVSSLAGRVPHLYTEVLPPPGAVLAGHGGARHTAGAFRFRGGSSHEVAQAITEAMLLYEIAWSSAVEPEPDA